MSASAGDSQEARPGRDIAILLHRLPDGSEHVDLLLGPGDGRTVCDDERAVHTWRCPIRPDSLLPGESVALEAVADHRGLYLRLANPIDLDKSRGRVTPLRRGIARGLRPEDSRLHVAWSDGGQSVWTMIEAGGETLLTARSIPEPAPLESEGKSTIRCP